MKQAVCLVASSPLWDTTNHYVPRPATVREVGEDLQVSPGTWRSGTAQPQETVGSSLKLSVGSWVDFKPS